MAFSIFVDALPFNEVKQNYRDWFYDMQVGELKPNIAYSSSLHWQLYCEKYPDDRKKFVDWMMIPERRIGVKIWSYILQPLDHFDRLGLYARKFLDKLVYRKNMFANIPFKFRPYFSENARYLFWDYKTYHTEPLFKSYFVISQDEGHISFKELIEKTREAIAAGDNKNIFVCTCFADAEGHKCRRGEKYSAKLKPYMSDLKNLINLYLSKYPDEEVLIVSDHGMSTIKYKFDHGLEERFGKQSKKNYIAYCDSCMMCVWVYDKTKELAIRDYLSKFTEGHLLSEEDRAYYKATDRLFGDIIFNLKEGYTFSDNWFGQSLRKPNPDGTGMHGYWPDWSASDAMASIAVINSKRIIKERYDYHSAHLLIKDIMNR